MILQNELNTHVSGIIIIKKRERVPKLGEIEVFTKAIEGKIRRMAEVY